MDLRYRKIIVKCKPLHLCARFSMYNSGFLFYKKAYRQYELKDKFRKLKESKIGKRCFIVGNGPSLTINDLNRIIDEDCFASNEIYKIFGKTEWRPKYFLIKDRYSKTPGNVIDTLDIDNIFLGDYYLRFNSVKRKDIICLHEHYALNEKNIPFSNDIEKRIYSAATVTYGLMQIIAYMGYTEVYMLGIDHNYAFELAPDGSVINTGQNATHFFKDEIPEDIIANVLGMTRAYQSFKRYTDAHRIKVRNATRGGKLEVFERVDFDSLFDH